MSRAVDLDPLLEDRGASTLSDAERGSLYGSPVSEWTNRNASRLFGSITLPFSTSNGFDTAGVGPAFGARRERSSVASVPVCAPAVRRPSGKALAAARRAFIVKRNVVVLPSSNAKALRGLSDSRTVACYLKQLDSPVAAERFDAMNALADTVQKGDLGMLEQLALKLEHEDTCVRQAAVRLLGLLSDKGNGETIEAVVEYLAHPDESVREYALLALTEVTNKGDEAAILPVVALLCHENHAVRDTAVLALDRVADKEDPTLVHSVSVWLEHPDEDVRAHALQALGTLDYDDASVLAESLASQEANQRRDAIKRFQMLRCRAHDVMEHLAPLLSHDRVSVRRAAANIMRTYQQDPAVAESVIATVVPYLGHDSSVTRSAAVAAIGASVRMKPGPAVKALAQNLEHPDSGVRNTAVQALRRVARGLIGIDTGQEWRPSMIRVSARASVASVGSAAAAPAPPPQRKLSICSPGRVAIDEVAARLGDEREHVRLTAGIALVAIAGRGDAYAVEAAGKWLAHPDAGVRKTALVGLAGLVERDDASTVDMIRLFRDDGDSAVRLAAGKALNAISDGPVMALPHPQPHRRLRQRYAQNESSALEPIAAERTSLDSATSEEW